MGDLIHLPVAQVVRASPLREVLPSREIYRRGKKAVRHFNKSCPSGLVMYTLSFRERRRIRRKFVVKHGYRSTMYSVDVPSTLVSKTEFCCPEALADLRAADRLPWPWRWLWGRYRRKLHTSMFEDPKVLVKPLVCISEKRSSTA
jgi:hypothetical protein